MFQFFRQLRQRLLTENRFRKYLLYAVGEILLVVIGILIALQVNAWVQRRESAEQEAYYLNRLEVELRANHRIAQELGAFKNFQNKNARLVMDVLNERMPGNTADQDFFLAIEHLTWLYERNFERDVWEELQSTGNIDLISDQELRTRLSQMYNALNFYTGFEEEWATYNMGYRRLLGNADIFSFETRSELTRALRPSGVEGVVQNLPDMDTTIAHLRKIRGLNGYLSDIILSTGTGTSSYYRVASDMDSLLTELKGLNSGS